MKSLPARPSLESLRKQAKKLARDTTAGDAEAIARARAHLTNPDFPLNQRDAQLVIAREYGLAGWQDLVAEVNQRIGNGVESALPGARRAIHENNIEQLKRLLAEFPALLSWEGDDEYPRGLVGFATGAYGDAGTEARERWFTRGEAAEVLIDAGAIVVPSVAEGILRSRATGLLHLFDRKGLLPRTLKFSVALGRVDEVHRALQEDANDVAVVDEAFIVACRFRQRDIALLMLDRCIALDSELGHNVDGTVGRGAFVEYFIEKGAPRALKVGLWNAFVMQRISDTILDDNLTTFVSTLQRDSWLLGDDWIDFQKSLIETAAFKGREEFIIALFDLKPAILRRQSPPPSNAIEMAIVYGHTDAHPRLISLLTRIWPVPDDLPFAAGVGNLERVKQWFDETGAPALGDLRKHYPNNDRQAAEHFRATPPSAQHVLDSALAFAVLNHHFEIADFLLAHGANINTDWNSHEPASILHTLVFEDDYAAMQFLIDRGIDMTMKDYRWNATAEGWARYGKGDEKMAQWLAAAERRRAVMSNAELS